MAVDPRLVMGLISASPRLIQLFQNLINKRGYDAGLMADNIMPSESSSYVARNSNNGYYLKNFNKDFSPSYDLQNTQPYLKDITNNTVGNDFKSINRPGPTEAQLSMYANRPDLLEKYYGDRNDIYSLAMKLGSRDYANEHGISNENALNNNENDVFDEEFAIDGSNINDSSPFGIDDFVEDDNPDDELSKLAMKILGGGGYTRY